MLRVPISLDADIQRRAQARAAEQGISFAEYIRRLIARDQRESKAPFDISVMFDLVDEGPATHIARDKAKMIKEAMGRGRSGEAGKRRTRARVKITRR